MNQKLNICQTCLSADRNLYPLQLLRTLLFELDMEEIKEIEGGVCWECRSSMRKFLKFKAKVRRAQDTIWVLKFKQPEQFNSLSTLVTSNKAVYDFQYDYSSPRTQDDEHIYIKQETETFEYDSDEEKPLIQNVNIYIEAKRSEEEIDRRKKEESMYENSSLSGDVSRDDSNSECVDKRRKYEKVELTEEEIEKKWSLKRSNPDFQKMPIKCVDCAIGFNSSCSYEAHVRKKHDESAGLFCCAVCKVRFPTEFQLNKHAMFHYRCYKCKSCDFKSSVLNAVLLHYSVAHCADAKGVQCKKCQLVVDTLEELNEHTNKMHKLVCNLCEKRFKGKSSLREHNKKMHNSKRGFVCDICSKSFTSKTRLETHMVTHNEDIAKQLAYCAKCDIQYKSIHVYRDHLRKSGNHSEEPFQCPDCDKKFASKVYWQQHNNYVHLKKSQFKCEICNKVFITFWKLRNHNQKHHGIARPRNYPCTECSKKFFTMEMLKNHRQIHSNERPFMCTDCGKTFKQSAALYNHTRIIHQGYKRKIRATGKADKIK